MTWALLPVKGLDEAKSRLAPLLTPAERRQLTLAMLDDVLAALARCSSLECCVVIGSDADVRLLAQRHGAEFLAEPTRNGGLNDALTAGLHRATERGATGALIVPADVPLIDASAIKALIDRAPQRGLAICPARDGQGTNGLILRPPNCCAPRFGPGSFTAHANAARDGGLDVVVVDCAALGLDIDSPDDLAELAQRGAQGATRKVLATLDLGERLARGVDSGQR